MSVDKYGSLADQAARKHGVDPRLFRALVTQESGWNPSAKSGAGAYGLTQVMPFHNADLSTPQSQLDFGAKYLSQQLKAFGGDSSKALAAYNAGPGAVQKYGGIPPYKETQNYVKTIMGNLGSQTPGAGAAIAQANGVQQQAPANYRQTGFSAGGTSIDPKVRARVKKMWAASQREVKAGKLPSAKRFQQMLKELGGGIRRAPAQSSGVVTQQLGQTLGGVQGAAAGRQGTAADGALMAAQEQLGVPYSWGGGTPSGPGKGFGRGANTVGFDCSSLVQYAWAKQGINLPRTTYEQIKAGQGVDASNRNGWQPGDLLFPHDGHVELYIGNGQMIHAPQTGGHVEIKPVRSSNYKAVRRVG